MLNDEAMITYYYFQELTNTFNSIIQAKHDKPDGTPEAPAGTPLPAALPIPGPGAAPGIGTLGRPSSGGGGPSTVMDTIFSPLINKNPRVRFSSRSGCFEFFALILRNSSQSPSIKFICLSNAKIRSGQSKRRTANKIIYGIKTEIREKLE